jgi:hypothetical protein
MTRLVLACVLLLGCDPSHTPEEGIAVCLKVCGARPLDDFSYKGDRELWVDCRCGKLEVKCDGGHCDSSDTH